MGSGLNARLKFIFFTTVALVLGVAFLWMWYNSVGSLGKLGEKQGEQVPTGVLLLSYALVDKETDSASLIPALFDFTASEAGYINPDSNGKTLTGFQHSFSSDDRWVTFIDSPTIGDDWPTAVYRVSLQNEKLPIAASVAPAIENVRAAFPVISNNGEILYMSVPTTTTLSVNDFYVGTGAGWDIVRLDQSNEKELLTQGSHPQWLGNEGFLFLKYDGVYYRAFADGQERLLKNSLSPVGPSHRLALNKDGTQALLIEPAAGAVRLFDVVQDQGGVSLQERDPIMVKATSAVFSPDGQQVAITKLPTNGSDIPLVVYDHAGNEVYMSTLPKASSALTSLQAWIR